MSFIIKKDLFPAMCAPHSHCWLNNMKIGDLVKYVRNPAPRYKWRAVHLKRSPGILIEQVEAKGTQSQRFKICWCGGKITEEWAAHLVPYKQET